MSAVLSPPAAPLCEPATPAWTVLCVDDEPNILSALRRVLRMPGYRVLTATSGVEALGLLERTPVDLLISDMRMPGMDGAALLEQVHHRWPQVLRMLLTGHADMGSTVAAINRGRILRYIHKPWDEQELLDATRDSLDRLALQREKDRLEALTVAQNEALRQLNEQLEARVQARTQALEDANGRLRGSYLNSIKVFASLLELRGGQFAGHGRRVAAVARRIARGMGLSEDDVAQVFVAGLLHDIGLIGMADPLAGKPLARYSADELALYRQHPGQAEQSLMALEDMQPVVALIRAHHERHDGQGFPDGLAGEAIPLGARILAVADAFDDLQSGHLVDPGVSQKDAMMLVRRASGSQFDPAVVEAFCRVNEPQQAKLPQSLRIESDALQPDMVLAADLVSSRGILMLTAGQRMTPALVARIREFESREGGSLQIHVRPPVLA
ncbi:MAG: response regulator [Aquabacterium sp.]|nr:response regulator [Aquabacterium sp.]